MGTKTTLTWSGGMAFEAEADGHRLVLDADTAWGGKDLGPRPKPLLLLALSGCSAMDVVSLLKKMRVDDFKFRVDVDADSTTEQPVTYHTIRADFRFWGMISRRKKSSKLSGFRWRNTAECTLCLPRRPIS